MDDGTACRVWRPSRLLRDRKSQHSFKAAICSSLIEQTHVALTISHRIPTMFFERELVIEGGLMTYAASFTNRPQVGVCVGSILKGPSLPNFQFSSRPSSKRTWPSALQMSAFGGKADMTFCTAHVCF